MRLVVGITRATGATIGIRLLEVLGALDVETQLVLSQWARATIEMETDNTVRQVQALAARSYGHQEQAAAISSGSFRTDGMIVPPVLVDAATAPCRQNVLLGDEASLDRFPIPMVHEHDGGRYANTWGTLIVKTPMVRGSTGRLPA